MPSEPSNGSGEADGAEPLWRTGNRSLPAVAALLVTAGAVVAVAVAGISLVGAEAAAADTPAELETSVVTVSENGTAEIDVRTDGADAFEIAIGDEETDGYTLRATVTPSGDGVTTLVFDHAETGRDGATLTAEGDAAVEIDRETALNEPIAPAGYEIELFPDGGNEAADVGTLMVEGAGEDGADGEGDDSEDSEGDGGEDGEGDGGEDGEPATVTEADVEEADVVVEPAETEVSVPVEVDDGETVTLRLRSAANASRAFIVSEEATVENGTAAATFDLSPATHGDRATLSVRGSEALDEPVERDVLVVDEEVGVEQSGGASRGESPGFGAVAAALALLILSLAARRRA